MIDFATPIRRGVPELLNSNEFKKVDSVFSSNHGATNSDIPDMARRIVSYRPAACVALAFAVGGIFGWLTSRR